MFPYGFGALDQESYTYAPSYTQPEPEIVGGVEVFKPIQYQPVNQADWDWIRENDPKWFADNQALYNAFLGGKVAQSEALRYTLTPVTGETPATNEFVKYAVIAGVALLAVVIVMSVAGQGGRRTGATA